MNKNELVAAVAEKAGLSKADAGSAVEAVFETITSELKGGGDVRLVGFGNYTVSHRNASKGRNPSTGAERSQVLGRQGSQGRCEQLSLHIPDAVVKFKSPAFVPGFFSSMRQMSCFGLAVFDQRTGLLPVEL